MAEIRGLVMRIQAVDGGFVRVMQQVGAQGEAAFRQLDRGQRRAQQGANQTSGAVNGLIQRLRGTAATIAVLDGPLGGIASRFNAFATTLGVFNRRMVLVALGLAGMGIAASAAAVAFGRTVGAGSQLERQLARLDAQVQLTEGRFAGSAEQINEIARRLGEDTLASAVEARDAASTALGFQGVGTENLERVLQIAQDMTEIFGGDLRTNVSQLGKAFVDPGMSMDELRRKGISFTVTQREMIDNFVEMGENAKAAEIILEQAERRVGGIARAAATDNLAGQWDTISELVTQVSEDLGRGYTTGVVRWMLGFAQIETTLRAIKSLTAVEDPIVGEQAAVAEARSEVERLNQELREVRSGPQAERAGAFIQTLERQLEAAREELRTAEKTLEVRANTVAMAETEFQASQNQLRAVAERNRLENMLYDARKKVTEQIDTLDLQVQMVGLPESEQEFRAFVRENFENLSPEIRPKLDLSELEAAFERLQAAEEAFEAHQQRIRDIERRAPRPSPAAPADRRRGFALGADARLPSPAKPDPEVREEFAEIRGEVDGLNVALERTITQLEIMREAEAANVAGAAGVTALLERQQELQELDIQAAETAAAFREHFGDAAEQAAGYMEASGQRMATALSDFAMRSGEAGEVMREFWFGVFADLSRRAAQFAITQAAIMGAEQAGPGIMQTVLRGIAGAGVGTRAEGGPTSDGTFVVGEKGPELMRVHGGGWVYPNHSPLTQRALQYMGRAQFGGEMTVGGSGGPDSQLVGVRATPGERISVSQPQRGFVGAEVNVKGMGEKRGDHELAEAVAQLLYPQMAPMVKAMVLDMHERHRRLAGG